jgi:DNA-binding XRE family transcriptional regulator
MKYKNKSIENKKQVEETLEVVETTIESIKSNKSLNDWMSKFKYCK